MPSPRLAALASCAARARPVVTLAAAATLAAAVTAGGCGGGKRRPSPADAAVAIDGPLPVALTAERVARLAALALPGAAVRVLARSDADLALSIDTGDARVTLTAAACLRCTAMEVAAWEGQRPALAALWAPGVDAVPPVAGAALTIDAIAAGGLRAIAIDARRGDGAAATAVAQWNDGTTSVVATCEVPALAAGAPNPCAAPVAAALGAAVSALHGR